MDLLTVSTAVLTLVAGIGVFLIACKMMSNGMETLSGDKLKAMFKKVSGNAFIGVGIGAFATALIQSSGATTVMVLGFVNARIMSLFQASVIVYGASIGTTITGQIVALGMLGDTISTTVIFSAFAGIGAFISIFAKKDKFKNMGSMLAGFGILFVGLALMSSSMKDFAANDQVKAMLETIQNPVLLVIVGTLLTAIVNSSSVMTSIAITMVFSGLISLDQGIYLALGANVGACITGILASITGCVDAKRVCFVNVIYKIISVIIFIIVGYGMSVCSDTLTYGTLFEKMFPGKPQVQLAMFHTFFNCIAVLLMLPFTNLFIKWSEKFFCEKTVYETENPNAPRLYYINDNMLRTPPVALAQLKNEIVNMAEISLKNFNLACHIICTLDYKELESFRYNEIELNYLNKEMVKFAVKLSNCNLNEKDRLYLSTTLKTISDLERVGDYAENIVEYADSLKNNSDSFSNQAVEEIEAVRVQVENLCHKVLKAYTNDDVSYMPEINMIEDDIDRKTMEMERNHIRRLNEGVCTPNVGAQYLSLATNIERIGDHYQNVAKAVKHANL